MKKMRKSGSYLSMENLEMDGANSSVSEDGDGSQE